MRHPVSRELFAYWDALRAGRAAPERSAIDPAAIRNLLAYTFLLEVGQPDGAGLRTVTVRLSGTRLNALFHRDLKGGPFEAFWGDGDEARGRGLLDGVLDDCTPAIAGVCASPKGYAPVDFELLLLPLRHHGRTHARLLGAIAAETVPSWIGLRPIEGLRLVSFRTIVPRHAGRLGAFGGGRGERDGAGRPAPSAMAGRGAGAVLSTPAAPPPASSRVPSLLARCLATARPGALGRDAWALPPPSASLSRQDRQSGAGDAARPGLQVIQGGRTAAQALPIGSAADLG